MLDEITKSDRPWVSLSSLVFESGSKAIFVGDSYFFFQCLPSTECLLLQCCNTHNQHGSQPFSRHDTVDWPLSSNIEVFIFMNNRIVRTLMEWQFELECVILPHVGDAVSE